MVGRPAREALLLGRFRLAEAVGRGAFGRVFRVVDAQAGEARALKIVPRGFGARPHGDPLADHEAMLLDEFEQLARLRHPALPRVFEVGRTPEPIDDLPSGSPFFVAEWIAGGRCDERAWVGLPDLAARAWALLADAAGALATIHAAGLVHGDVAPQNVLYAGPERDAGAVLVDLGLAAGRGARGTPAYMAPEALAGDVEPRSDLYGLGAVAVRLATGRPLFDAPTLGALAQQIVAARGAPALPGLPRPLADLIGRLVARDAAARPSSALAVLDELDQLAAVLAPGSPRRARPKVGPPPAPGAWPGAAAIVEALGAAVIAGAAPVVILVGGAASGARELADAAVRRWQLGEVARGAEAIRFAGSLDEIAAALAVPPRELARSGVGAAASDAHGSEGTASGRAPVDARGDGAAQSRASADARASARLADGASARAWLERVARAARRAPGAVVVELADDPRAGAFVAALVRAEGTRTVVALVERAPDAVPAGALVLRAPVLDADGAALLAHDVLGAAPPRAWAEGLRVASEGQPLAAIELLRAVAAEREPFAIDWRERSSAGAAELRAKLLRAVPPGARRIAAALAAWGGRARTDRALATARADGGKAPLGLADIAELERAGLARRTGTELALDRATLDAVENVVGADTLARLATAALATFGAALGAGSSSGGAAISLPEQDARGPASGAARDAATAAEPTDSLALAPLLERAPLDAARARLACEVAEDLLARGRGERALALAKRAIAGAPARAWLIASRAASSTGAYRDAAAYADAAADAGADPVEARLAGARAAQRAGELDAAERALAALHAAHPAHAEVAGAYARLLVTRSRYADARVAAASSPAPLAGLRAEAAGLASFYLGALEEADAAFAALEAGAAAANDTATVGRAASLRGMVAQQRGQLGLASDRYRDAARRLGDAGELHAAAVAELNLGTVLVERGRASEALPRLAAAGRVFAELGATTELCAAELNRGNALVAVGQAHDARAAAAAAIARADGAPHLRAFALIVLGDADKALGDATAAARAYRDALAIATERGDAHAQISAHIALAEAGHRDADGIDVDALCASGDDRDRWTLARARRALIALDGEAREGPDRAALPGSSREAPDRAALPGSSRDSARAPRLAPPLDDLTDAPALLRLARGAADVARRASEGDRLERAYRGHALAAQLAQRAREPAFARAEAEQARAAHAALIAATAPAFRVALDADADLARIPGADSARAVRAADSPAGGHLRRLLTLSRRLNTEASVERILDDVIDTAIELTAAERGFLLLRQADGALAAVVSRNFHTGDLEAQAPSVSRSIAERAAQTGEPVVTVDAGLDERFGAAASVAALRLRSVLAVPLRQRGALTGCIYVDHRLRGGAFDDAAASVLGELADIAAIAIENARLTADLRRTTSAVEELNGRLAAELAERDAELVRVKADLPDRDRLRHSYARIVGRSPAMVRMLDTVDRAAATALPVVITGESGTGKELVARALHDCGPRKAAAFVAINCSAVPEPLLESELFGHVRGAFTGAERDRRGLFEVADGGTLFLDEIADTSAAMQAKLLRVLQDGELRRVGDTRTHKVDVRVIAASQQPLAALAAAGRFREDLRFRLEVITVTVPPLRERDGDVPLLVAHLLAHLAPDRAAPRLTRAAQRALGAHRWPGNVRELENALARGVAMGGDVIDVGDLPEAIAAAAGRPEPAKPVAADDLRLKPAITATEQAYVSAAMARAKGNQTVAARLLGLSRFGLQKKLRRLAGEPDGGDDE